MNIENIFGKLSLVTDKQPVAGEFREFRFLFFPSEAFTVQPRTMIEIVHLSRFYSNQFSLPQINDPTAPGYVIAKRSDGKFIGTAIRRIPDVLHRHGASYHIIQLTLGETPLEEKGHIEIIYGFKGAGGPGTKCPPLAKLYSFPIYISQRHVLGGKRFYENEAISFDSIFVNNSNVSTNLIKECSAFEPKAAIAGGLPEKLRVIVSSRSDNKARITVNATDMFGNLSPSANGTVEIENAGFISIQEGYGSGYADISQGGIQRLNGTCRELGLSTVSNPFRIEQRVAWGEIHSHSGISDGLGTDDENYLSAVRAGLDFGALSDHDTLMEKDAGLWKKTAENAEKYNNEPEFITLLGYEALAYEDKDIAGHINIYYPGADGPMEGRPQLNQIPEICKKHDALAIPHHTMYGGSFFDQMGLKMELMEPEEFNAGIMPVCEIYSTHGCSERRGCERSVLGVKDERSVNAALGKGFRWGFIGGSDNHESLLGHNFRVDRVPRTVNNEHMQFRHGMTAAFVEDFSRTGVFNAIKDRSVYATTGERILLDFNVNGVPMGNELITDNQGVTIEVSVAGTAVIEKIEIVRNGDIIHSRHPGTLDCDIFFVDETPVEAGTYYYIKAVQTDGEMAWSSPVWLD